MSTIDMKDYVVEDKFRNHRDRLALFQIHRCQKSINYRDLSYNWSALKLAILPRYALIIVRLKWEILYVYSRYGAHSLLTFICET